MNLLPIPALDISKVKPPVKILPIIVPTALKISTLASKNCCTPNANGLNIFKAVGTMIGSIFTGGFTFDMLNGPVGIYHNVDSVVKQGIILL
jgi:membrane-associated protease RseP (regulator of RpoE activity)